ncbi:MAG: glycosyltransferase [Planctomycetota bacterium]
MPADHDQPVTWLLPVRNGMPYLPDALASIAAQTDAHHTVLAYNDGSTDHSVTELNRWFSSGKLAGRILSHEPVGLGRALARLVEAADTPYVARLDADDTAHPERLAKQRAAAAQHPTAAVIGTQHAPLDDPEAGPSQLPRSDADIRWALRFMNPIAHPSVLLRREAVLAVGNYRDLTPGQDYDLWLRLAQRFLLLNLPEPLLLYRRHDASITAAHNTHADQPRDRFDQRRRQHLGTLLPNTPPAEAERLLQAAEGRTRACPGDPQRLRTAAQQAARAIDQPDDFFTRSALFRHQHQSLRRTAFGSVLGRTRRGLDQPPSHIVLANRLFHPHTFGGLERVLLHLTHHLTELGHTVTVLTEQQDPQDATLETLQPGLHIFRQPKLELGRLWRFADRLRYRWWLDAFRAIGVTRQPHTSVWVTQPDSAAAACRLGLADRTLYRPVFCYASLNRVADAYPEMAPLRRTPFAVRLDRLAYQRVGTLVAQSQNLLDQYTHHLGTRSRRHTTRVVLNGVSPPARPTPPTATHSRRATPGRSAARHRFGFPDSALVLGFVGRPGDPCKDLRFLLDAVAQLPEPSRHQLHLLLVGGGSGLEDARHAAHARGLDALCHWTGNLTDPAQLDTAYAAMDLLAFPSRFETFGNVILEAAIRGVPAIARRRDASPGSSTPPVFNANAELISDNSTGWCVDPHDPTDLARQLERLIADRTPLAPAGHAAQDRAQRLTWDRVTRQYLDAAGLSSPQPTSQFRPSPVVSAASPHATAA